MFTFLACTLITDEEIEAKLGLGEDGEGDSAAFDSQSDTDTDTDTDSDSDTDADTDSDTDADTDSDTDTDTDIEWDLATCRHSYDPVEDAEYSRTYDVTFQGEAGTGTQESFGTGYTSEGVLTHVVYDEVTTASGGWSGSLYVGCDVGGEEGVYLVEWDASVTYAGSPFEVLAAFSAARRYLPAELDIATEEVWSYSYTYDWDLSGYPVPVSVTGTYTDLGFEYVEMADGTSERAVHLLNEYTLDMGGGYSTIYGELDQWFVAGLGLVQETNTNVSDGSVVFTRVLTEYSGLTPR